MPTTEDTIPYSHTVPRDRPAPRSPATLSVAETAELLGVAEKAVRTAITRRQIQAVWIGRYVRVLRAPLLEMLGLPPDYETPRKPDPDDDEE